MIIVHAVMPIVPERRGEVEERGAVFAAACREEEGCVDYQLSWAFGAAAELRLLEHWESPEAYQAHTEQPHVKEWATWIPAQAAGPLRSERMNLELANPQGF